MCQDFKQLRNVFILLWKDSPNIKEYVTTYVGEEI